MSILNEKLGKKELIIGLTIGIICFIITLACFNLNKKEVYYQIIFDSNGGSEIAGQNILKGNTAKYPSETTKEGYTFEGWYYDNKKFDFNTKINKDITLKAKWTKIIPKEEKKEEPKEEIKQEEKTTEEKKEEKTPQVKETPTKPTTIDVTSISLNTNNLSLKVGESSNLTANVQPANATNKNVTWTSDNPNIVTVSNGNIRAINPGTTTIRATAGGKTANCTVTVTKVVTYSVEMPDVPGSAIGQCYIYIKSSEGNYVSGTVKIDYIGGGSRTVNVTPSGIIEVRKSITNVTIVNAG